jgi:hypothetical protein
MFNANQITSTFVRIKLQERQLLLPLDNRFNLESMTALQDKPGDIETDPMIGAVLIGDTHFPVYHLADDFSCISHRPARTGDREMILLLSHDEYQFGLLCRELSLVEANDIYLSRLPEAMRSADGLVEQVWVDGSIAVGLLYPTMLMAYLISLGACSQQQLTQAHVRLGSQLHHQNTLAFSGGLDEPS